MDEPNEITYSIEEIEPSPHSSSEDDSFQIKDYNELINEIDNLDLDGEMVIPLLLNYNENFTIKELMIICDYYGFSKVLKANKLNKEEIIHYIVRFELDPNNSAIVFKRQNLWFYINELKHDKFMKKFVIW